MTDHAELIAGLRLVLDLLAAEDGRQTKLHDLLETIREQIRLDVAPEHRPVALFTNSQNAVYAMRGRTPLCDDAAITEPLREATSTIASLTGQVERLTRERDEQRVMFLYEADKHSEWLEKFMDMKRRAEAAEAREKRLREALEWYVRQDNYMSRADPYSDDRRYPPRVILDGGDRARAALDDL